MEKRFIFQLFCIAVKLKGYCPLANRMQDQVEEGNSRGFNCSALQDVKDFFIRATRRQFSEDICSEDDLRSRIFGTLVVKCLACLPVLGFSNF